MIDVHCHIDLLENPQEVVDEAKKKMMEALIVSVADPNDLGNAMTLRNDNKGFVHICAGFHPNHVNDYEMSDIDEYIEQLRGLRFDIVGIGEVGLDYHYDNDEVTKAKQRVVFSKFIEFAIENELPLVIHIRDAFDDALDVLGRYKTSKVILHCFSGSEGHLKKALERGYMISFATNVCYTKKHPRLAAMTPLKNMVLETDSPWLHPDTPSIPEEQRSKINRPWNIEKSANIISEVKKITVSDILKITSENSKKFFRL